MSDTDSERPLTRRERRLLEMQQEAERSGESATGSAPEADPAPEVWEPVEEETIMPENTGVQTVEVAEGVVIEIDESLIEVPTVGDDGKPLSRREMRMLRQEAIDKLRAEKLAELEEAAAQEAEEDPQPAEADVDAEAEAASVQVEEAPVEFEDVPTEALSLEDLQQIEQEAATAREQEDDSVDVIEQLLGDADTEEVNREAPEESVHDSGADSEVETEAESQTATQDEEQPDTENDEEYSFPDIQPLGFERPVFDDPSVRTVGTPDAAGLGTGFEDMIERAVADENASVHTGTSSLILPSVPGSDGLSGPIGSTGELFVTGSFELPKSIGETGGHSNLQESIEADGEQEAVDMLGLTDVYETSEFDSAPVSASKAVSARSLDKAGITTPEVQPDNKKSMILIGTGGGLILILIGAGIWVAQSGLFG